MADCLHQQCEANVEVIRDEKNQMTAKLSVRCQKCGTQFHFMDKVRRIQATYNTISIPMLPIPITTTTPPMKLSTEE